MKKTALVIFQKKLSEKNRKRLKKLSKYDVVISPPSIRGEVLPLSLEWRNLDDYIEAGSIYEATDMLKQLSYVRLPNGTRVTKSTFYNGFELWWIQYQNLFLRFCLPYTQHKKLLEYLNNYEDVVLLEPQFKKLFECYLLAHRRNVVILSGGGSKLHELFPLGIMIQILLTFVFLPIIILQQKKILIWTGDLFEGGKDFDFRLRFVYEELRKRNISFLETIRSLESWRSVLQHAARRRRAVVYSTAITFLAHYASILTGKRFRLSKQFRESEFASISEPEERFMLMVATQYLQTVGDDIWEIRINRIFLKLGGVKVAFIPATNDRNFHTFLACKLNNIPTVGILHGVASQYYNVYDFLHTYDGEKTMSVDKYGVWSDWWKEYYVKNSKAYSPEQLFVSGLMRPFTGQKTPQESIKEQKEKIKVLFVSEQLAVPDEVFPHLRLLLEENEFELYVTFRPYQDGFEMWLKENHPEILQKIPKSQIIRTGIKDAIHQCDVAVGTHSTAVLEAVIQKKPFVFFKTGKWGDYFNLEAYSSEYSFYVETERKFLEAIKQSKAIPVSELQKIQERFFGDPCQNGSKWVVDELVKNTLTL